MENVAVLVSNFNKNVTSYETIDAIKESGFKKVFIQWYKRDIIPSEEEQLKYIKSLGLEIIFAHLGYRGINNIWEFNEEGDLLVNKYKKDIYYHNHT